MGPSFWRALALFLFLAQLGWPGSALANTRYAALVVNASTGEVLYSRKADQRRHPASLTKMMTLFMLFEALDRGDVKLSDQLAVSRHAYGQAPSKLGLKPGDKISVEDAILGLVTKSANDVAVVIAEALAGTEWQFAREMTKRARALGMSKTTFRNASGLHHRKQVTTARDMALLARRLRSDFPEHYGYFSVVQFQFGSKKYKNHNRLLVNYDGTDGIKTGYIRASGFNLVASVARGNQRLVAVVFGGRSARTRDAHIRDLLDRGFARLASADGEKLGSDEQLAHDNARAGQDLSRSPSTAPPFCVDRGARVYGRVVLPACPG